jgi:hypothetical protein
MSDVAQEIRRRILNSLEAAQSPVLTARNSTKIPTGYENFELVPWPVAAIASSVCSIRNKSSKYYLGLRIR